MKRILAVALLFAAPSAQAECGFCADTVTLTERLALCYVDRLPRELAKAQLEGADVHLVDLSACLLTRAATPLTEEDSTAVEADEAFLLPVETLSCLADKISATDFADVDLVTFDVGNECP